MRIKRAIIETIPASPNKYENKKQPKQYCGNILYKNERDRLYRHLLCSMGIGPRQPFGKCRITITMNRERMLDEDNARGACKPLIDCLKIWIQRPGGKCKYGKPGLGWIVDDNPSLMTLQVFQTVVPKKSIKTEILIEEIE